MSRTTYDRAGPRAWQDTAKHDDQGRLILGDPRGCPHCQARRQYTASNGKAVWYFVPPDCCDERRQVTGRNPLRARRKDVDE